MRRYILALLVCAALPLTAQEADVKESMKFSVAAFGDYYWVVKNHNESLEDRNGFWFRRIYLTADQTLSRTLSARVRLEASSPGDFATSTTLEPFFKDAWIKWHRSDALDVYVGLVATPAWDSVEQFWGYRALEKTPIDLYRLGSSRDTGIALMGKIGAGQRMRYHFAAGNGSSTGAETNAGKLVALRVGFDPTPSLVFEVYGDFDDRAGSTDRMTAEVFAGWRGKNARAGLQYTHQSRERANNSDLDLDVASAFAIYNVTPRIAGIVRVDRMFDPNPDGDRIPYLPFATNASSTLFLAGADVKLHKRFGVIPNVEWITYGDAPAGADVRDDLMARVTFYYSF